MIQSEHAVSVQKNGHILFLVLIIVLVYSQSLVFPFLLLDDTPFILNNPGAHSWKLVPLYFLGNKTIQGDEDATTLPYYRPLAACWVVLNYKLFGDHPVPWRLAALALYAIGALLFNRLVWKLTKNDFISLAAALLFALHPSHVESVAWISGSTVENLLNISFLGGFLAYLRWQESRKNLWLLACGALTLLALLSKETAIALPVLIVVHALIFKLEDRDKASRGGKFRLLSALITAIGVYAVLRVIALGAPVVLVPQHTWAEVVKTAPFLFVTYMYRAFWPVHLALWYDTAIVTSVRDARFYLSVPGCVVFAALTVWALVRKPLVGFLLLWWALTLVAPILGVRAFPDTEIIRDRFSFMALAAMAVLVASALHLLPSGQAMLLGLKARSTAALAILVTALGMLTAIQVNYWANDFTVYVHSIKLSPRCATPRILLANIFLKRGDIDRALAMDQETLTLAPSAWQAYFGYGMTLETVGKRAEAIQILTRGIQVAPKKTVLYQALANVLVNGHDLAGAARVLKQGIPVADRPESLQRLLDVVVVAAERNRAPTR